MLFKDAVIYHWPYCQICLECEHSVVAIDDESGSLTGHPSMQFCICIKAEKLNDGVNCPSIKLRE